MSNTNDRWDFYRDAKFKWRWRRIAVNGRIVDASTQGYSSRSVCIANARRCGFNQKTASV